MNSVKVLRYKNVEVPRQQGEVARLRVLKGPDHGMIFVIKTSSVAFGRGEEVDVKISDLKASRTHARLDYTREGWVMNDTGSANGIFFQGEYTRKFNIVSGEHFTVGETIFEFLTSTESTRVLTSPLRASQEVSNLDQALVNQRLRVQSLARPAKTIAEVSGNVAKANPRTLILFGLVLVGGYFLYFDEPGQAPNEKPVVKSEKKSNDDRSLASYLPVEVNKEVEKTAEQYYRQGFREFREGNFLRAKAQFELALQVNPNHAFARHYLAGAENEISNEIKRMIEVAQKSTAAGRLREAKGYYETAMRLMYYDRSNPDFIECNEALKLLNAELNKNRQ